FAGGLMLGAIFMATDYTTTPTTLKGRIIFAIGCGVITTVIRIFGSYDEGVSFAILFMNLISPLIDRVTRTKPFGKIMKKEVKTNV
ncbi:MAG: RnfABCDGE type electron transport complex subunit D, partial [Oscillospiraceae bacterium]